MPPTQLLTLACLLPTGFRSLEGKDAGSAEEPPQLRMEAALADYLRILIHLNYQFLVGFCCFPITGCGLALLYVRAVLCACRGLETDGEHVHLVDSPARTPLTMRKPLGLSHLSTSVSASGAIHHVRSLRLARRPYGI